MDLTATVPLSAPERPCAQCQALAYSGRHEPYLVSDIRERLRLWRCSICQSLWCEREHDVSVITEAAADELLPHWRTLALRVQRDLDAVLAAFECGEISIETLQIALLHQDVWLVGAPAEVSAPGARPQPLKVFSSAERARRSGGDSPQRGAASTVLARTAVSSIALDPEGPHRVALDGQDARDVQDYAASTVRRGRTDARVDGR